MTASGLLFVGTSALVNRSAAYRRSPFALITSFGICLYFVLPVAFITALGDGYRFGDGLESTPRTSLEYASSAPWAVLFLSMLLVAMAAGLSVANTRHAPNLSRLTRTLRGDMPVVLVGFVVIFLTQQGAATIIQTRLSGNESAESLLQFIFFDHAYLMLLPLIVYRRLSSRAMFQRQTAQLLFAMVLLLFVLQATIGSTSKGFILTVFTLSFVIPISALQSSRRAMCLVPSNRILWAGVVGAISVFFVAEAWRVAVFTGSASSIGSLWSVVTAQASEGSLGGVLTAVGYRMSSSVDRYILIFNAHLSGHSWAYGSEYATYLGKNFVNLIMPGSPYPEAYMPSSNLLPAVLFRRPLMGAATKAELIVSLNTQPYTAFGVSIILGGLYSPFLVYLGAALVSIVYRLASGAAARLSLIYLVFATLHSYGPEVVVANGLHAAVSLFIFIWLMRSYAYVADLFRARPLPLDAGARASQPAD